MSKRTEYLRAQDIHARIGARWPEVLERLGIPGTGSKKARPCPACGGRDRFVADNRSGRGDYLCRGCGAGDGFSLLQKVHGWTFRDARRQVLEAAGITLERAGEVARVVAKAAQPADTPARPSSRAWRLASSSCALANCPDAVSYLASRALWPPPADCTLRAHPSVEYFDQASVSRVGRFPGLVALVRDIAGELVTVHVTYLNQGAKLSPHEPRKLLSGLTGRTGCAVRLMPASEVLGIAEGIETSLAAAQLHGIPTWAALNTALLGKFEPPATVRTLVVFADRDAAGLEAAGKLLERLQGRVRLELRIPPPPAKDWNDVGRTRARGDQP